MTSSGGEVRVYGEHYVLGERLSAHEHREVWRAHDDIVGRAVALTIWYGEQAADPAWQQRFARAADRLARLSHPGIATAYEHGATEDETWLAVAYVDGEPLSRRRVDSPPRVATSYDIVGQVALALAAAHDAGITHGALSADHVLLRGGDVATLVGFEVVTDAARADDLRALVELAETLVAAAPDADAGEPAALRGRLVDDEAALDAREIGRRALALAAARSGGEPSRPVRPPQPPVPETRTETEPEAAQRRQVRNRMIVLAIIVVVGGAALLRFVGKGGGEVTVPSVIGMPLHQAQLTLFKEGLNNDLHTQGGGSAAQTATVTFELPAAGTRVKAGSTVVLTVAGGSSGR